MRINLLFIAWFGVGSVFGGSAESGVFQLDTSILVGQTSSVLFSCATDQLLGQESSPSFSCATDQLRDQQTSATFLCNVRTPKYASGIFMADTHSFLVDSDGNGLPNIWEMKYFEATSGTIPTSDADQDGSDNLSEYISGTNPQDSESIFVVHIDGHTSCVEWLTVPRRTYTLQYTSSLTNEFTNQAEIMGTGDPFLYPCLSIDGNGFFRVKVRLQE